MILNRNSPNSVTNVHLPDVDEAFATKDTYAGRLHGRLAQRGGERRVLGFELVLRDQRLDDSEIEAAVLFASSGCRRLITRLATRRLPAATAGVRRPRFP
jgi:hypothetical protein